MMSSLTPFEEEVLQALEQVGYSLMTIAIFLDDDRYDQRAGSTALRRWMGRTGRDMPVLSSYPFVSCAESFSGIFAEKGAGGAPGRYLSDAWFPPLSVRGRTC